MKPQGEVSRMTANEGPIQARAVSEQDLAKALREEAMFECERLARILDKITAAGFVPNFNFGLNQFGRWHVSEFRIVKPLVS